MRCSPTRQRLDVVSNNVANQNVTGYTRQTVHLGSGCRHHQRSDRRRRGRIPGSPRSRSATVCWSRGCSSRRRRRRRLRQRQTALNQLQSVFGLTSSSTSAISTTLGSAIDSFYNTFSSLAVRAIADTATRQAVLSAASNACLRVPIGVRSRLLLRQRESPGRRPRWSLPSTG